MDNIFGFGNSPVLTGYFIVVLVVLDVGVSLLFEKRSFCRYMCPINGFIGLQGLFAGFEMRSKSSEVCKQCRGKWCRVGREDAADGGYGCPMFLYPGGNDTNKYCILCTECLKSCPNNTMRIGLRPPLKDLWANKAFGFDESFNSMALIGVSSIAPLILINYTKPLSDIFIKADLLGGNLRMIDIISKTILYISGLAVAILGLMLLAGIAGAVTGSKKGTKHYVTTFTGVFLPIGLMKLIADILDHIVRNASSVIYVVYNFVNDFPRGSPDAPGSKPVVSPLSLNDPVIIYALQAVILTFGFVASSYVIWKQFVNWEPQKKFDTHDEAKKASIAVLVISLGLSLMNIWALSGPAVL